MKNKKGITLIALIITIIVMLILVSVTINVALNGGLFEKAEDAKTKTQKEVDKEMLLSAVVATVDNSGNVNLEELELPEGFTYNSTTKVYKSKTGNEFIVDETTGKVEDARNNLQNGSINENTDNNIQEDEIITGDYPFKLSEIEDAFINISSGEIKYNLNSVKQILGDEGDLFVEDSKYYLGGESRI